MKTLAFALVALGLNFAFALSARADFSGPYYLPTITYGLSSGWPNTIGAWQLTNVGDGYANSFIGTSSIDLVLETGTLAGNGLYTHDVTFADTVAADGILSFDYAVKSAALSPMYKLDYAGYLLNGLFTALPTGTGSASIPVHSGDLFAFEAVAHGNCIGCNPTFYGDANLHVTSFNAPVPEPTTLLFLSVAATFFCFKTKLSRKCPFV